MRREGTVTTMMYRHTLTTLWTSSAICGGLAIITTHIPGHLQGVCLATAITCAIAALGEMWIHKLGHAITINRDRTDQLRTEVDQLRTQLGEVRDLTEAIIISDEARNADRDRGGEDDDYELATVHQFRLRRAGHDIIVGSHGTSIDADEIWAVLDTAVPGRHNAS